MFKYKSDDVCYTSTKPFSNFSKYKIGGMIINHMYYIFQIKSSNSVYHPVFATNTADCGPPPFLLNGALNYQDTMEGAEGHYHCRNGFTLEGRMTSICKANGNWDSTPICIPQTGRHTTLSHHCRNTL